MFVSASFASSRFIGLLGALLGALVCVASSPVGALTAQQQCLIDKQCVERVPKLDTDDTPRDAQGYTYKTCHSFSGRNYPCSKRFGGTQTDGEDVNLDSALATFQDSLDSSSACVCADGSKPLAALEDITPWATPESPFPDFCAANIGRLPTFYKDLIELRNERRFTLGVLCAGQFAAVGGGAQQRARRAVCPAGTAYNTLPLYPGGCARQALDPLKSLGRCPQSPIVGNPLHAATGNKYQRERDYLGAGAAALRFERHYNSHPAAFPGALGRQWRHTYERELRAVVYAATHLREDGRVVYFARTSADPESPWRALDPDVLERLEDAEAGELIGGVAVRYRIHSADGDAVESYDARGRLLAITAPGGLRTVLEYAPEGPLLRVSNPFGRSLEFGYHDDGRLRELRDPAGQRYLFGYDGEDLLASVLYPSPAAQTWQRRYLYTDPDLPGGLTDLIDERGVTVARWDYDDQGRAVLSEHAGGVNRTTLRFLDDGDVEVTDALGNRSRFGFQTLHHLRRATRNASPCTRCGGRISATSYDPVTGFRDRTTDFNGVVTDYDYDPRGLEVRRVEAVGTPEARTTRTTWHPRFRQPTLIEAAHGDGEPVQRSTAFTYSDDALLLTRTITDLNTRRARTTTWRYTDGRTPGVPAGLIASVDGPRTDLSDLTVFRYHGDGSGNLLSVTNALAHTTTYTDYDDHGRPTRWSDPNGLVTVADYDPRGRLTTVVSDARVTRFDYDATGNLTRSTAADGSVLTYHHDDANRLLRIEDAHGNRLRYELDAAGHRTAQHVEDAHGNLVRTSRAVYDALGRLAQRIEGEGQIQRYGYDAQGNRISHTDALQRQTLSQHDALNRLRQHTAADLGVTRFDYDARDNLIALTDPRQLTTSYLYNALDERIEQRSPDTGTTVFDHDEAGNLLSRTDARGISVLYRHDALNRLTAREYPDASENVRFTYDTAPNGLGRLARVHDASGTTSFEYDRRGNLRAEHRQIRGRHYTTGYTHDALGRVTRMTYPSGRTVAFSRGPLGRVAAITLHERGAARVLARAIDYQPFGARRTLERGNGLSEQRAYDRSARLVALHSPPALDRVYDYDASDNITAILALDDPARDQRFDYDLRNRLTGAQGLYGVLGFDYDALGNRRSRTDNAIQDVYHYAPGSNRLLRIDGPNAALFQYDDAGNLIARGDQRLSYNDAGRLAQLSASTGTAHFVYNAFGERVTRDAGAERSGFIFDARGTLIARLDGDGAVSREYVYLDGAPFAVLDPPPEAVTQYRMTQPATATSPALSLTLDPLDPTLTLTEGNHPPRVLTQGVSLTTSADGVLFATAPLGTAGWIYMGVPTSPAAASSSPPSAVVYDPPGAPYRRLNGSGSGADPALTMLDHRENQTYQMSVDPAAKRLRLSQDAALTRELDLSDAKWLALDPGVPDLDYLVVIEDTPERYLLLRLLSSTTEPRFQVATLILRDGYGAYRIYRDPELTTLGAASPTRVHWYHTDHLATPHALSDDNGQLSWQADALPFGETIERLGTTGQGIRFPGQYWDDVVGAAYNYQRYYDPSTGRYLTSDPIGLDGGLNTYTYAFGNPVSFSDPSGLNPAVIVPGGIVALGSIAIASTPQGQKMLSEAGSSLGRLASEIGDAIAEFCRGDGECAVLRAKIDERIGELKARSVAGLVDKHELYTKQPFGKMSWESHVSQFQEKQRNLRKLVRQAKAKGCSYNPEADRWANEQFPKRPVRWMSKVK